jgi:co-chaperonin GroES (HSP10)
MFQPLHALLTVVLDKKKTQTDGGVILPDTAEASTRMATVQAVGSEIETDHPGLIVPGDRVLVGIQKGRDGRAMNLGTVEVEGKEVVLVNFTDIWGVFKDE